MKNASEAHDIDSIFMEVPESMLVNPIEILDARELFLLFWVILVIITAILSFILYLILITFIGILKIINEFQPVNIIFLIFRVRIKWNFDTKWAINTIWFAISVINIFISILFVTLLILTSARTICTCASNIDCENRCDDKEDQEKQQDSSTTLQNRWGYSFKIDFVSNLRRWLHYCLFEWIHVVEYIRDSIEVRESRDKLVVDLRVVGWNQPKVEDLEN